MAIALIAELAVSQGEIDRAEDMYHARDRERLRRQIETGDIRAADDQIITRPQRNGS